MDLLIGFFIVLFIVLSFTEVWNSTVIQLGVFDSRRTMDRRISDVAESLVKTTGSPPRWFMLGTVNSTSVKSMGFAARDNVLSGERLGRTASMDYDDLRSILGLSREEYYITVTDLESANKTVLYSIGRDFSGQKAVASRFALLNGTIVEVKVSLYFENTTFMTT